MATESGIFGMNCLKINGHRSTGLKSLLREILGRPFVRHTKFEKAAFEVRANSGLYLFDLFWAVVTIVYGEFVYFACLIHD